MQKEFQKLVDYLLNMANSDNNYEDITEEIKELDKEISLKKNEVKQAKMTMSTTNYAKENDRIIDENIKIGLENKRLVYNHELEKTMRHLNKASTDEEDLHDSLTTVVMRLKSLRSLEEVLNEKLKNSDKSLEPFYESMLAKENEEKTKLLQKKEQLTKQYDEVKERLSYYGNLRVDIESKLTNIKTRLEDTLTALSNPNFYVDEILKKKDEEQIDTLNKELEDLETQKLKLITDPVYIANEANNLFLEEDYPATLNCLKELVTIIKSKPYMEESLNNLKDKLSQSEETLEAFTSEIENKTYLGEDSKIVEERIDYLKNKLDELSNQEKIIQEKINKIDRQEIINIDAKMTNVHNLYDTLKDEYEEYKNIIFNLDENTSPRKKASLQSAYTRKKQEMEQVNTILNNYQKELETLILQSEKLQNIELVKIKEEYQAIDQEILSLKKQGKTKVKDILAMEKDKNTLKELSDDVEAIKHRQKFKKTADEVYNELETLLTGQKKVAVEEKEVLNDFRIEEEPIVPLIKEPYETVNKTVLETADQNIDDTLVFPPRNMPNKERLKVVSIEPLKTPNEEKKVEQLETLNTNEEDEYISFNDILNSEAPYEN